jgi:hypothetical protein
MNRKEFIRCVTLGGTAQLLDCDLSGREVSKGNRSKSETVVLYSDHFQLTVSLADGLYCHLVHVPSGIILADAAYSYSFSAPSFIRVSANGRLAHFRGVTKEGLEVEHHFKLGPESWMEEEMRVRNLTSRHIRSQFRSGFVLPVQAETLANYVFTAVPYRREPRGDHNQYADYSVHQILYELRRSQLREDPPRSQAVWPRLYEEYASEGWAFTDGKRGFLLTKYNQTAREYALLDSVVLEGGGSGVRWGGAGTITGDPEGYCDLGPGDTHDFGTTRLTPFSGDVTQGFYTFRGEMESRGHGIPGDFDPPVHWNELYDNKLWWVGDPAYLEPVNRRKYYRLEDMQEAAASAKAIGCEALYLDPGWDTPQSSKIWDEERLGTLNDFVALLRSKYGLRLSLHTPLTNWVAPLCDVIPGTDRLDRDGKVIPFSPCGASRQYIDETSRRLTTLAGAGVAFFMFDGTWFNGDCWSMHHGHSVPSTMAEHVDATNRLARLVHKDSPDVLIEMHDQAVGGSSIRYVPTYYGHGKDQSGIRSFDSIWAFELMWDPMADLISGHSVALYYYNLAYSLPLYIHIDLRTDNAEALVFWWNASTCRHLGIGGTSNDPLVRAAHKSAMLQYRRYKDFFSQGIFYGIDEMTHVHRHPHRNAAIVNCFNLDSAPVEKSVTFEPRQLGLPPDLTYQFSGTPASKRTDSYIARVRVPALGHALIEVTGA